MTNGNPSRRKILHLGASASVLLALPDVAKGQAYPSRPVTIVVPFAAGGGTDIVGRILAERMRPSLGQTVVIENISGANGSIGVGRVARAAPDGHTLSVVSSFRMSRAQLFNLSPIAVADRPYRL